MNRLVGPASLLVVGLVFCLIFSSPASATWFIGTPSDTANGVPFPSPTFGTLENFDKRSAGDTIGEFDYVSVGIASIKQIEAIGNSAAVPALEAFSGSSQSFDIYLGTGSNAERGNDASAGGFDGTILIKFANLVDKVGVGISDSLSSQTLSIYGADGPNFPALETHVFPAGSSPNTYVGFERLFSDIAYFEITGNFFLIDDLQFRSQAVPEPAPLLLLCCSVMALLLIAGRKGRTFPTA
jgi:hypothetical protein